MKNTKDYILKYPAHSASPVQTVGAAFSTVTGEALPGIILMDAITGYHYCREVGCLTKISKGGPLLCPEHQFASGATIIKEALNTGFRKCLDPDCHIMLSVGSPLRCPHHRIFSAEAVEQQCKEETYKSVLVFAADSIGHKSQTYSPIDSSFLPLLSEFMTFLAQASEELAGCNRAQEFVSIVVANSCARLHPANSMLVVGTVDLFSLYFPAPQAY